MKKFILTNLITIIAIFAYSQENISQAKYQVNMHCESCKNKIENLLNNIKGVQSCQADLFKSIVVVNYNPDSINTLQIAQLISNLGYQAIEIQNKKKKNNSKQKN